MKLVICLMGLQCSGINLVENYLIEAYGIKKFKGYTTRKKRKNERHDAYHFIKLESMIDMDYSLLAWREYDGDFYARKLHDIPDGISVGVIDYNGYLELKQKVNALAIYIDRGAKYRFNNCNTQLNFGYQEFLERNARDEIQYNAAKEDNDVMKIIHKGIKNVYLEIDDIIFPYIEQIERLKRIEKERIRIMKNKISRKL